MKDQITGTRDALQTISDELHQFVAGSFPDSWVLVFQIIGKFLLLAGVIYLLDFLLKLIINSILRYFVNEQKYPILLSIRKSKVTNSIAHLIALSFGSTALYSVFYRHPKSFFYIERSINFIIVLALAGLMFNILKAIENYYLIKKDYYRILALKAISQTLNIFGIFIFTIIAVCVIFGIGSSTILGSLGAITAVMVLIFRDTILGFVTGLHVATSKNLKVGDWIRIPKYNLEGTIEDINVLSTKILNFDKTISTIPTYDLLSTEIKNLQVMSESNTRRIKKSIIFDINSFRFVDDEMMGRLEKINLLHDYLVTKRKEISEQRKSVTNADEMLNDRQLTNIGTFREYARIYLRSNSHVDQNETLLVRQLDINAQGLPLEIYCFANSSKWVVYEQIQADIFDHLLVASREFGLEVMQVSATL